MDYRYMPFYIGGSTLSGLYYQPWEDRETKDLNYLREMYPKTTSVIRDFINDECDRQEFEGSMMYDEFPDRLSIMRIVERIYGKAKDRFENNGENKKDDTWLKEVISVMLLNEIYDRRKKRRNFRKRYY